MLGSIFSKKQKAKDSQAQSHSEIAIKVAKMNLTEMRSYVNNKLANEEISEEGLYEVIKKLTTPHETTTKLYVQIDDMDLKKKKAFDLILLVSKSKKITIQTVELMQKFTELYAEIIKKFDLDYKEIYESKLNDAIAHALANVNELAELQRKMNVLGE